jgi:1-aminocyclopropane-1-carboxylate deaminase
MNWTDQLPDIESVNLERWTGKTIDSYFLRLDRIHPLAGGNKWFKLNGFLSDMKKHDVRKLVTYGGPYSNHLIATAIVAKERKLSATGIVRGEVRDTNQVIEMCQQAGMRIISLPRPEYDAQKLTSGIQADGTYHIPEGGQGMLGEEGIANMVDYRWINFDFAAVSAGTGTTYTGLTLAPGLKHMIFHVFWAIKGAKPKPDSRVVHHTDGHRGGFGKLDSEMIGFTQDFHRETGILLDPVYTSKMMMSLIEQWKTDSLNPDQRWLIVHTGGWTGWLSERNLDFLS